MSRSHPPLLLRLAVVVGAASLLLGLVGVVWLVLRGDEIESSAGPGLGERVRIVGIADDVVPAVDVRWEDDRIVHVEPARPLASAADAFLLPPGLAGRSVVVQVRDARTSRLLVNREIVPVRGEEIRIEVEPAAER